VLRLVLRHWRLAARLAQPGRDQLFGRQRGRGGRRFRLFREAAAICGGLAPELLFDLGQRHAAAAELVDQEQRAQVLVVIARPRSGAWPFEEAGLLPEMDGARLQRQQLREFLDRERHPGMMGVLSVYVK
jgi:hypothetical protein